MHSYEAVIGLEIHAQLLTHTKIFCGCSTTFGAPPNTHVCPVCLGYPGALPVLNRSAVDYAVLAALALGCEVQEHSVFARKNYFYPDLPKGYQISQYRVAARARRRARSRRWRQVQARAADPHPHGRGCGQVAARGVCRFRSPHVSRLQPRRRPADRDCQRAGHAIGRRSGSVFREAPAVAGVAWRQRRQHGGRQPAVRCERIRSPRRGGAARHQGRSQERQLVSLSTESARVRDRAANRCRRPRRSCRAGDPAVRLGTGADLFDAQQGTGA